MNTGDIITCIKDYYYRSELNDKKYEYEFFEFYNLYKDKIITEKEFTNLSNNLENKRSSEPIVRYFKAGKTYKVISTFPNEIKLKSDIGVYQIVYMKLKKNDGSLILFSEHFVEGDHSRKRKLEELEIEKLNDEKFENFLLKIKKDGRKKKR